jgi:hypothetical protein
MLRLSLAEWSVPALVVGVPGLLLVLAVALQLAGGTAWLPIVRKSLRGVGLHETRQRSR